MKKEKKKFYQKGWFLWLMLIFLPPIGIILLWACHKKMNKILKVVLSVIFAFWFLVLMIGMSGSEGNDGENISEGQIEEEAEKDLNEGQEAENEIQSESNENFSDKFVENVVYVLYGSEDAIENISDVIYEDRTLCIYVELSQTDPSPLTYEALAMASAMQITDRILQKLPEHDELWDVIRVDFGNVGYAEFTKDDIMGERYTRCFDMANFVLVTDTAQQVDKSENETVEDSENVISIPVDIDVACRAITKTFVTEAMEEKYSMFAYEVSDFDLDDNNDGTIDILYFPYGAGIEGTKVNLTISKKDTTYEIVYALLAGGYEVMLDKLPEQYVRYVY